MRIIGFGGAAGSGKSTAAELLREVSGIKECSHFEFSDPIVGIGQSWLLAMEERGFNFNQNLALEILCEDLSKYIAFEPGDKIGDIPEVPEGYINSIKGNQIGKLTPETKIHHRPLLEWIGKSAIELASPMVWGDMLRSDIEESIAGGSNLVTIGGVRTVANSNLVHDLNGKTVKIIRSSAAGFSLRPNLMEYQLNEWQADYTIYNNGSIEDLRDEIKAVWYSQSD